MDDLRQAVLSASTRPDVLGAVGEVYAALNDAIDIRRPICKTSGRCCRFEEFGHRLYVSTMELANFVAEMKTIAPAVSERVAGPKNLPLPVISSQDHTPPAPGCPFQIDGLCSVRSARPFGCRIFFCDETSTLWQQELYEQLHGRLRQAHDDLAVPYFYVEWRFALKTLGYSL